MVLRTFIQALVKSIAPEALVRIDQLLHSKHTLGVLTADSAGDLKLQGYEGAWTPALKGSIAIGSWTYIAREGRWYRHGSYAYFEFQIRATSVGAEGNLVLFGFPLPLYGFELIGAVSSEYYIANSIIRLDQEFYNGLQPYILCSTVNGTTEWYMRGGLSSWPDFGNGAQAALSSSDLYMFGSFTARIA